MKAHFYLCKTDDMDIRLQGLSGGKVLLELQKRGDFRWDDGRHREFVIPKEKIEELAAWAKELEAGK